MSVSTPAIVLGGIEAGPGGSGGAGGSTLAKLAGGASAADVAKDFGGAVEEWPAGESALGCQRGVRADHETSGLRGLDAFEYLAVDLDPARIRLARHAGDNVVFGDSADEELLRQVGLDTASAVIITFADPAVSVGIARAVRRLRANVPLLVRTQDDVGLAELMAAGVTEVVPETFEASLMLVSHVLMLLHVPVDKVLRTVGDIRATRYSTLRHIFRHDGARVIDETHAFREELRSIVLPPGAWSVGRRIEEVRARGAEVSFTALRRQGITGREPEGGTELREGDIVVIYGTPGALEHAEAVLLAG